MSVWMAVSLLNWSLSMMMSCSSSQMMFAFFEWTQIVGGGMFLAQWILSILLSLKSSHDCLAPASSCIDECPSGSGLRCCCMWEIDHWTITGGSIDVGELSRNCGVQGRR